MSAASVAIGAVLVSLSFTPAVLLAVIAAFLITAAGNSVNDALDVEADRVNRPKRPIPSGRISRTQAAALTSVLFAAGIVLAALTGSVLCLAIASLNSALLVLYSASLQNKVFLGNVAVAYLACSTFLFGGAAAGNIALPVLLMLLSGLATFAREIVKDLEDVEGDRKSFLRRMKSMGKKGAKAKALGERFSIGKSGARLRYNPSHASFLACASIIAAAAMSAVPYLMGLLGPVYLALLIPTDGILLYAAFLAASRKDYGKASTAIKWGMAMGLLAFLLGSFF